MTEAAEASRVPMVCCRDAAPSRPTQCAARGPRDARCALASAPATAAPPAPLAETLVTREARGGVARRAYGHGGQWDGADGAPLAASPASVEASDASESA